jgi:hypothetical protein
MHHGTNDFYLSLRWRPCRDRWRENILSGFKVDRQPLLMAQPKLFHKLKKAM